MHVSKSKINLFKAAENKHEDHHGAEHRNVHGDDEDSIHHHHKNEVGRKLSNNQGHIK